MKATLLLTAALAVVAVATPAWAQPYGEQTAVEQQQDAIFFTFNTDNEPQSQFAVGERFHLGGLGFPRDTDYLAELEQNPTEVLVSFTIDSGGFFFEEARIPTSFRPGPATLRVRSATAGEGPTVTRALVLEAAEPRPAAPAPAPAAGPKLPTTGMDAAVLGAWGLLLLGTGFALVTYTRRRQRPVLAPAAPARVPSHDLLDQVRSTRDLLDQVSWTAWEDEMAEWEAQARLAGTRE